MSDLHRLKCEEHPSDALLEFLLIEASAPSHEPTITRAVNVMNDWTSQQLDKFICSVENGDVNNFRYYEQCAYLAEIALKAGITRLTRYGLHVAETLNESFPVMIENADKVIEHQKRFVNRKQPRVRRAPGYVYLIKSPSGAYKIGRTKNPTDRLKTFGIKLPFEVEYVCLIRTTDMYAMEADLHAYFAPKRINGEWFALSLDDVEQIKEIAT